MDVHTDVYRVGPTEGLNHVFGISGSDRLFHESSMKRPRMRSRSESGLISVAGVSGCRQKTIALVVSVVLKRY